MSVGRPPAGYVAFDPERSSGTSRPTKAAGITEVIFAASLGLLAAARLHRAAVVERGGLTRRELDDATQLAHWALWVLLGAAIVTVTARILWRRSAAETCGVPSASRLRRDSAHSLGNWPSGAESRRQLNRALDGLPGVRTWRIRHGVIGAAMFVSIVIADVLARRSSSTRAELATAERAVAAAFAFAGVLAMARAWCAWQLMTRVDAGIDTVTPGRAA